MMSNLSYKQGYIKFTLENDSQIPIISSCLRSAAYYVLEEVVCDLSLPEPYLNDWSKIFSVLVNIYSSSYSPLEPKIIIILPQLFGEISRKNILDTADLIFSYESLSDIITEHLCEPHSYTFFEIPHTEPISMPILSSNLSANVMDAYDYSVLGGTFDHLHPGHMLLLTAAAIFSKKLIGIGITKESLLINKQGKECLQSFDYRCESVKSFLKKISPSVEVDTFELFDPVGPSGTNPIYQVVILTEEVEKAFELINKARETNGLNKLEKVVISLLTESHNKAGSTQIRNQIIESSRGRYCFLKERWYNLCKKLGIENRKIEYWWEMVSSQYNRKFRYYHTLNHIYQMYSLLDNYSNNYSQILELSIWFHDVIYYADYKGFHDDRNNEVKSKDLFINFCKDCGINECYSKVESYILATITHRPETTEEEELIFLDLDMSILGASEETYNEYSENIKREYSFYSDEDYRKGRCQVMQKFLERDHIYYSDYFRPMLENQARNNISREIDSLQNMT
ncbi:unnamed protein product [Blepharisma stoltei]|uniref:Cytidyltransferase-like domain-containing protein n=1 Tax=Blepharisma stoltei TaxID=1481888 RepID=A0AAU9J8J2_9CILI|nr:unnamed protein product [Blepharisma stoltei]